MALATKDPARTRAGPNLHHLRCSPGAHDCEYLVLTGAGRFLQRLAGRSVCLVNSSLLSLYLSSVSVLRICRGRLGLFPVLHSGNTPYTGKSGLLL